MNRNYYLLITLLLAFALRLYRLDAMTLRADEATNLYLAAQEPSAIARVLLADDPHAPLYYFGLHYWLAVAGQSEFALRFPNVFTGVLVVALVYALARVFFSSQRAVALLAALFAAVSPMLVWDSQDVYMYSFLTATVLTALLFFARLASSRLSVFMGYVVVTAASFYLHYFALFPQLAQGALWLYWSATRQLSRRASVTWVIAQVGVALLFAPWLAAAFPFLTSYQSNFFPPASWLEMLQRTLTTFAVGRTDARLMSPVIEPMAGNLLALGFFAIAGIGGLNAYRAKRDRASILTLLVFLFAALFAYYAFSIFRFPVFDERYVIYLTPIFLLLLARAVMGFSRVYSPVLVALFVLLVSAYSLNNYFHVPAFAKSPDWHAFTRELLARARAGDVLIQNYPDPALPYYLQARLPRVLLPRTSPGTRESVANDLNQLAQKYERLWLQPVPNATWDTEGYVVEWLARDARQVSASHFRGVDLSLYLPAAVALKQAQPINAMFDARVRLLAFEVTNGENRRLVLYWQTASPLARDYTVFVHLYDADDKLVWQKDNAPVAGTFPTREWQVGEIVVDEYLLPLPPDLPRGQYRVMVGLYDSETRARLRAMDARGQPIPDDRVLLTTLSIN